MENAPTSVDISFSPSSAKFHETSILMFGGYWFCLIGTRKLGSRCGHVPGSPIWQGGPRSFKEFIRNSPETQKLPSRHHNYLQK